MDKKNEKMKMNYRLLVSLIGFIIIASALTSLTSALDVSMNSSVIYTSGTGGVITTTVPISAEGGNSSFNQTLTDLLYYRNSNPNLYYNSSNFNITDYTNTTYVDSLGNWTANQSDYNTTTNINTAINDANNTMKVYVDTFFATITMLNSIGNWTADKVNYYLNSNPNAYYNSSNFSISDYVPYTGAINNVALGTNNLTSTALTSSYLNTTSIVNLSNLVYVYPATGHTSIGGNTSSSNTLVVGDDITSAEAYNTLVVGQTLHDSKFYIGQSSSRNLVLRWVYSATTPYAQWYTQGSASPFLMDGSNISLQSANNDNNVGIGTSTPRTKLFIKQSSSNIYQQTIKNTDTLSVSGIGFAATAYSNDATTTRGYVGFKGTTATGFGDLIFGTRNSSKSQVNTDISDEVMRITNNGDVVIGKTTATAKLEVNGSILANVSGTNKVYIDGRYGYIGINTTAPTAHLTVNNGGRIMTLNQGALGIGTIFTSNDFFKFVTDSDTIMRIGGDIHPGVSIGATYSGTSAPTDGLIVEGNVGIGVTAPTNKLQVVGNISTTGNMTAAYYYGNGSQLTGILMTNTSYATTTYADSLGNWTANFSLYNTTTNTNTAINNANSTMKVYVDNTFLPKTGGNLAGDLNMTGPSYNITNVSCIKFNNGASLCTA